MNDLADERLSENVARELHRHVEECTDCRVARQRAARLQQLLALKRFEQPSSNYFDTFLNEFHQRLEVETAPHTNLWERIINNLAIEPVRTWRYGFTGAAGVALAVVLIWRAFNPPDVTQSAEAQQTPTPTPAHILASSTLPAPHSTPQSIAATLPDSSRPTRAESRTSSAGNVVIVPLAAHNDTSATRYVLDSIGITPASYEVASIHF